MIGRGVDQILPDPCPPGLHEDYMSDARDYVGLAERVSGRISTPADYDYIWGASLDIFDERQPDVRIVNLETSVTRSEACEKKSINYRVSPQNAQCLRTAGIDCCVLANNHVRDWGQAGLLETLATLERMGIKTAGAGRNLGEARREAVIDIPAKGRVVVLAFALPSSGAPPHWAATTERPGISLLPDLSSVNAALVCDKLRRIRGAGDVLIVSLHCGPNWGYEIAEDQQHFARRLIDAGGASIIHGHSSHHPKALEIYKRRLILYGCGDFLNDYEGIEGYEEFRGDLSLMYFADIDAASGELVALELAPLQIKRFRLERAKPADVDWLARLLDRESARFRAHVRKGTAESLSAAWDR